MATRAARRSAVVAAKLLAALVSIVGCSGVAEPGPRLVLVVRHAEKATDQGTDPPLTRAGEARAQALAQTLSDAGIRAIVTSGARRTQQTAQPLAERLGIEPRVVPVGGGDIPGHARATADAVRGIAAGAVLVVGHSNTVPAILEALGAPRPRAICDTAHGHLFMLVRESLGFRLVRARYGEPDPPPGRDCE